MSISLSPELKEQCVAFVFDEQCLLPEALRVILENGLRWVASPLGDLGSHTICFKTESDSAIRITYSRGTISKGAICFYDTEVKALCVAPLAKHRIVSFESLLKEGETGEGFRRANLRASVSESYSQTQQHYRSDSLSQVEGEMS